jgi:hypothetical protein
MEATLTAVEHKEHDNVEQRSNLICLGNTQNK